MQPSPRSPVGSVADVMRRHFVTASPEDRLAEVRQTMRLARLRHLVVARSDQLVGLLSYRSVLELLLEAPSDDVTISTVMIQSPRYVTPATSITEAADRLCRYGFGCLPVVEEREPKELHVVGLVTETDLLRAAFRR